MHKKAVAKTTNAQRNGKPPKTNLLLTQPDAMGRITCVPGGRREANIRAFSSAGFGIFLPNWSRPMRRRFSWVCGPARRPAPMKKTWRRQPAISQLTFSRDETRALKGKICDAKAPGGLQYSGEISDITVQKKVFSGTAVFKLGENPLQAVVTGPLKGKTIQGTFSMMAKGEKIGEGTFNITKEPVKAGK